MRDGRELRRVVGLWRRKADEDFKIALALLKTGDSTLTGGICFHVQQAVEKYIKASLVRNRIGFPKTHSIRELLPLLPVEDVPDIAEAEQDRLTDYAVMVRYPGEEERIRLREAEEALRIARRVRRFFRKKLAGER